MARLGKPLFVQISDTHIGFNKEANPDVAGTLKQTIALVNALAGGSGSTAGGRDVVPPSGVTVADSVFRCSDAVTAVSFHGVRGGAITGNRITGIAPEDALDLDGATGVSVR